MLGRVPIAMATLRSRSRPKPKPAAPSRVRKAAKAPRAAALKHKKQPAPRPSPNSGRLERAELITGADRSSSAKHHAARELSWMDFDRMLQVLARRIARDFKPEAVVGVVHGGVFVGGALASALNAEFFGVRISRRSRDTGKAHTSEKMPRELKGRRVLIADDIASSGDTLMLAARLAKEAGAKRIATAALVSRPMGFTPDFTGETTGDFFVFPWDYAPVTQDSRFDGDPGAAGA